MLHTTWNDTETVFYCIEKASLAAEKVTVQVSIQNFCRSICLLTSGTCSVLTDDGNCMKIASTCFIQPGMTPKLFFIASKKLLWLQRKLQCKSPYKISAAPYVC